MAPATAGRAEKGPCAARKGGNGAGQGRGCGGSEWYSPGSWKINIIRTWCLDITLEDKYIHRNLSASTNIARMLVIRDNWDLDFSDNVKEYIYKWVRKQDNPTYRIWEAHTRHYKKELINMQIIERKLNYYAET